MNGYDVFVCHSTGYWIPSALFKRQFLTRLDERPDRITNKEQHIQETQLAITSQVC